MKKILVILVLLVATISNTLQAANDKNVSKQVQDALAREFAGASYVQWEAYRSKDIYQASFILNQQRLFAFFDGQGKLLSTGRYIPANNLPILVSKSIDTKFSGYQVKEAMEYTDDNETVYAIVLENEKKSIVANAYSGGNISIISSKKKISSEKL